MGRFLYLCRILILVCSYESEEYSTQGIARFWHGMKLSVINTASKGVKTRLNGFSRFRKYLKQWSEILQSVQRGGKFHVLLRGRHKVYPKRVFVAGLVLFNSSRRGYKSVRKPFSIISTSVSSNELSCAVKPTVRCPQRGRLSSGESNQSCKIRKDFWASAYVLYTQTEPKWDFWKR